MLTREALKRANHIQRLIENSPSYKQRTSYKPTTACEDSVRVSIRRHEHGYVITPVDEQYHTFTAVHKPGDVVRGQRVNINDYV